MSLGFNIIEYEPKLAQTQGVNKLRIKAPILHPGKGYLSIFIAPA